MFLALILGGGAFALIAWLVFNFSVYALPFFVGITAAKFALGSNTGMVGAGVVGLFAGGLSFGSGQFAFAAAKSGTGRIFVVTAFAAPAAIAGYFSTYGIIQLCCPAEGWRQAFSLIGGSIIAAIAYGRVTALALIRERAAGAV